MGLSFNTMARYTVPQNFSLALQVADNTVYECALPDPPALAPPPLDGVNTDRRPVALLTGRESLYGVPWFKVEATRTMRRWEREWCMLDEWAVDKCAAALHGETLDSEPQGPQERYEELATAALLELGAKAEAVVDVDNNDALWVFAWRGANGQPPMALLACPAGLYRTVVLAGGAPVTVHGHMLALSTAVPDAALVRQRAGMVRKIMFALGVLPPEMTNDVLYSRYALEMASPTPGSQWLALSSLFNRVVENLVTNYDLIGGDDLLRATFDVLAFWHTPLTEETLREIVRLQ
jgi:hypothetical protein